jgi:hypothetical protein
MIVFYILFFLYINFIIYALIQNRKTVKSKLILIISLLIFEVIFTKSYIFIQSKFADIFIIKPFGMFVLLTFSIMIPILIYMKKLTSKRLKSNIENNESLMDNFGILSDKTYTTIVITIITFLQVLFLWSGIVNSFK